MCEEMWPVRDIIIYPANYHQPEKNINPYNTTHAIGDKMAQLQGTAFG
jgi:hypothetical protein